MPQQPFLKLPREVRDMIYINALAPTGHIVLVSNGSLTGPQRLNLRYCSKDADEQSFSKEPLCLNLSLTCRQVRSEAEEIFWKKNRLHIILGFQICWREQVHDLVSFWSPILTRNLKHVQLNYRCDTAAEQILRDTVDTMASWAQLKSFYFSFGMKRRLHTSSPDELDECFDTDGDHPPPRKVFRRIHPNVERKLFFKVIPVFVDHQTETVESDLDYRLARAFKLISKVHDHFGGPVTIGTGSIKRTLGLNGEKWTDDTIREKWLEVTSKSLEAIDNSRSEDSDAKWNIPTMSISSGNEKDTCKQCIVANEKGGNTEQEIPMGDDGVQGGEIVTTNAGNTLKKSPFPDLDFVL